MYILYWERLGRFREIFLKFSIYEYGESNSMDIISVIFICLYFGYSNRGEVNYVIYFNIRRLFRIFVLN